MIITNITIKAHTKQRPINWHQLAFTFLNCSRLTLRIPKHSKTMTSCTPIKTVGSSRCTSIGNKYQANCSNSNSISSNVSVSRCPISHDTKTKTNTQRNNALVFPNTPGSIISFDCKNGMEINNKIGY